MSIHVVHVEDDRPLKDILRSVFQATDPAINLHQFTTADEAIMYIQENISSIDLFVLDIRLPGDLNGVQLAGKIRELKCPAHIILTSAYSRPKLDILETLQCEYYPKPWHLMEIAQKLFDYQRSILPKLTGQTPSHSTGT